LAISARCRSITRAPPIYLVGAGTDEAQSPCGLPGLNKPGSDPATETGKKNFKKATKMLGMAVLIFGTSDSLNSSKLQLVIAKSQKI
jgi:hypothetical protein